MPTVAFRTLGCRLNQAESDLIADQLVELGFTVVPESEGPDVVVVNSCTVTKEASRGSRQMVRRAISDRPGTMVVLAGCYVDAEPEEAASMEGVSLLARNSDKALLANRIAGLLGQPSQQLLQIGRKPRTASGRSRVNIRAQTGCDEWCSFCIIPKTRGSLASFPLDEIVSHAKDKVALGAREIVLTGVHLGKFGWDHGRPDVALVELIEKLLQIDGLARLRLSSILCRHVTPAVVELIASESRICRFLHIPLQSGHDDVLKRMNRPYSVDEFMRTVEEVRDRVPGIALSTDVIVGFPGETDEHFAATMDVAARARFLKMHVFRYSSRPGTASSDWTDVVPPDVAKSRSKALITLGDEMRKEALLRQVGRTREVFIEETSPSGTLRGHTDDFIHVETDGPAQLVDRLARVHVTSAERTFVRAALLHEVAWDQADPRDLVTP